MAWGRRRRVDVDDRPGVAVGVEQGVCERKGDVAVLQLDEVGAGDGGGEGAPDEPVEVPPAWLYRDFEPLTALQPRIL